MKNVKILMTVVFLGFLSSGMLSLQAQDSTETARADQKQQCTSKLQEQYLKYFNFNREAVFLHLNKTTFIPGEGLFFSAYSFDPRVNTANAQTTNLKVDIYKSSGERIDTKTIYMENGVGKGQFDLKTARDTVQYKAGDYLLTASTRYMKNFPEDLAFSQRFRILDTLAQAQKKTQKTYDLQLLPEGGHLVKNTANRVGVKLIDDTGKGVSFTAAKLLDAKGSVVTTFKSNRFGLSRFTFTPKKRKDYTVQLKTSSGKVLEQELPRVHRRGIAITTNVLRKENIFLSVKTNERTFKSSPDQSYVLALHRQGFLRQWEFKISEASLEKTLKIDRQLLKPGINTLTVFKDGKSLKPVAERMVFSADGLKRMKVGAEKVTSGEHAGQVKLSGENLPADKALSVSVLPQGSAAYNPDHSILSAFYLKPFIKGDIENGRYYFKRGKQRRRQYDLDLLLLTQGWSKFDWNRIFNYPPTEKYKAEQGFKLKGTLQGKNARDPENSTVLLKGSGGNLMEYAELDQDQSFEFDHVFLKDTTQISVGLINTDTEEMEQPDGLYLQVFPLRNDTTFKKFDQRAFLQSDLKQQESPAVPPEFASAPETLDTVVLKTETAQERENRRSMNSVKTFIDQDIVDMSMYITDYISGRGFRVKRSLGQVRILSTRSVGLNGPASPTIYIDGTLVSGSASTYLYNMKTSEVKTIEINKSGLGHGLKGNGGVIKIETRRDILNAGDKRREKVQKAMVNNGYSSTKEFYRPEYNAYQSRFFEKYGVINWYPDIHLKEGGQYIDIFNTLRSKIRLYISGMADDGTLVSEEITVDMED